MIRHYGSHSKKAMTSIWYDSSYMHASNKRIEIISLVSCSFNNSNQRHAQHPISLRLEAGENFRASFLPFAPRSLCDRIRVSVLLTGPRHFIKPSTVSRNLSDHHKIKLMIDTRNKHHVKQTCITCHIYLTCISYEHWLIFLHWISIEWNLFFFNNRILSGIYIAL